MKWWEKTVEYLFVIQSALTGKLNLSPLDGTHELAGDLIASENSKFILIEFKCDYSSISTEKDKFEDGTYETAKLKLERCDDHHFIVYGKESNELPGQLILFVQTYFSGNEVSLKNIYSSGKEIDSFHIYLKEYLRFKKIPATASGGGRSLSFAMVAAVDSETGQASSISLDEYFLSLSLRPTINKSMTLSM
ncbi:hypothetical protein [Cellvibrio sp. BR]|uniref:hypothetical protein n=1 Tax=Cellvibrio sp. BR TaxID=1134474 RepID=UPI0005901504|nr:hypothetical protein [Cellvibrio sp. BR]